MGAAKVVVITGCATGIGRALAIAFSRSKSPDGAAAFTVYATDKRISAMADLEAHGIRTVELDVQSEESVSRAVDSIMADAGKVDILVCNAGVHCGGFLAEIEYSDIEETFDINVHGTFRVIQGFAPHMMARRIGVIATMCDPQSWYARPFNGAYEGSKAAVATMSEGMGTEVAAFGVHVIQIYPGWVQTKFLENGLTDYSRYDNAGSFYQSVIGYFRQLMHKFSNSGPSAEKVAQDIVKGLTTKKLTAPKVVLDRRYNVYTASPWLTFWKGFLQQWLVNGLFAWHHIRATGLSKLSTSKGLESSRAVRAKAA